MPALYYQPASTLSSLLAQKQLSSTELTQTFIQRVETLDSRINAFLSYDVEDVLSQAKASDARRARGETLGPLDGIPVGIKDLIAVKDQPFTCASKILENFLSPYDATVSSRLKQKGAILWGRLNMDEFAMGSSTETSAFKKTANPWQLDCVPGGSSGGSAACVAAGEAPFALGSDTGGSIRQPAAFCGIVGMKPTYGLVSRYGLAAFASSLDQIGPMARSIEDIALLLQTIAGHDPFDSTSLRTEIPDYVNSFKQKKGPWTIGVPEEYFGDGLNPEIRKAIEDVKIFYQSKGCKIVDMKLKHTPFAVPVYYLIATAEASSNLARYDGVRYTHRSPFVTDPIDLFSKSRGEAFGQEVKRRIILGTYALSSGYYDAYYSKAQKVRTLIRQDFMDAFEKVDVILSPTTPTPAFKMDEKLEDPLAMYLNDIFTISANLAGLPALSLPCGFTQNKLPIGFQLIGAPLEETNLFAAAHFYEKEHDFCSQHPL